MNKFEAIIQQYEKTVIRFREVLSLPKTDIIRDSAIKRFELTFDLSWKLLKAFLEEKKGVVCNSPKECFREAYRQGIIEYDESWLKFVDMRNETVHIYREEIADEVYNQLPDVLKHLEDLFNTIKKVS